MLTLEEKRAAYNIGFKHAKDLYEPKEAIWKKDSINSKYLICSACGAPIENSRNIELFHFCPQCGAHIHMTTKKPPATGQDVSRRHMITQYDYITKGVEMNFTIENITPEKAIEYLGHNIINRGISPNTVLKYADDMKNGAWQLNGQAIIFNKSGRLIDGQHRLSAIVKSGVTVTMAVIRDVEDTISIYDLARPRNQLDSIIIDGYDKELANSTNTAMARLYYYMQTSVSTVSTSALKRFFDKYKDTLITLASIRKMGHDNGITIRSAPFMLAFLYAIESGEDPSKIKEFANVLASGFYQSEKQTAAIVLRNDILLRKIPITGGSQERKISCCCIEHAISDFCQERPRKITYMKLISPVYSNNTKFKEEKK